MKLVELIEAANKYYDDGILTLEGFYDKNDGSLIKDNFNDTLARFVIIELNETYNEDWSKKMQIAEACRVLNRGIEDLKRAVSGLKEAESVPDSPRSPRSRRGKRHG